MSPYQLELQVFAKDVGTTAPQESLCVCEVSSHTHGLCDLGAPFNKRANKGTPWKINTRVKLNTENQNASINPNDYLVADLNGVVCIPRELAEKVVALIPSQVEADERIAKDLQASRSFVEASKEHRASVKTAKDV